MEDAAGESDLWNASLSPEKRAALRELHRLHPARNLIALAFAAIWIATGWAMTTFPLWAVRIPGYFVIGMIVHAMAMLMHEGIHGSLFRNRVLDRGFGFLLGAPALFSCTASTGRRRTLTSSAISRAAGSSSRSRSTPGAASDSSSV